MWRTESARCRASLRTGMTTETGGQPPSGDGTSAGTGDECTMTSVTLLHATAFSPHGRLIMALPNGNPYRGSPHGGGPPPPPARRPPPAAGSLGRFLGLVSGRGLPPPG